MVNRIRQSAFWLLLPAVAVSVLVGVAIASYEPLIFDPALYSVQRADAAEVGTVDAAAIEAEHANGEAAVEIDAIDASVSSALADGSWTGYAVCGKGNPDGWKPYYIGVTVEVEGGSIAGISRIFGSSTGNEGDAILEWDAAENQKYLDWAIAGRNGTPGLKSQLADSNVAMGVDAVSGATYSSAATFNAYVNAVNQSAAAAGGVLVETTPITPDDKGDGKAKEKKKAKADVVKGDLADGEWTGYAACGVGNGDGWKPYYVAVTVEVEGGAVKGVKGVAGSSTGGDGDPALSWDAGENQAYLDWAVGGRTRSGVAYAGVVDQIEAALAAGESPSGVDAVSGATYSSRAVFEAYYDALRRSAEAAGSTIEAPDTPEPDPDAEPEEPEEPAPISEDEEVGDLADGEWTGYAACGVGNGDGWKPYYVAVTVEVEGGAVKGVKGVAGSSAGGDGDPALSWDAGENRAYLDWAVGGRTRSGVAYAGVVDQIEAALAAGGSPSGVDAVSGATYSSRAVFEAYYDALRRSAEAAGSTIDEPDDDAVREAGDADDGDGDDGIPDLSGDFVDGEYEGFALCEDLDSPNAYSPYYVIVKIKVENGAIVDISDVHGDADGEAERIAAEYGDDAEVDSFRQYDAHENASYLNKAINGSGLFTKGVVAQIRAKLEAGEEASAVDTISGATWSSKAIIEAFAQAVEHARA